MKKIFIGTLIFRKKEYEMNIIISIIIGMNSNWEINLNSNL